MSFKQFDPAKEFEFALPLPINFSVGDNNFENSKQKYPRRIKLFVPLDSIDNFCNHLQAMKNNPDFHKEGKVFDMQEGTSHMAQGINLWGNGKKNTYDKNEDDENRLFYVGATRTKEHLHIIRPKNYDKCFPMEEIK